MRLLPLGDPELPWETFESFCLAVLRAMPEVVRADKYGQQGEKQKGIDLEADLKNGKTRSVQCRQRKRFPPKSLEKTIAENAYGADENEIWISCGMSVVVSDAVNEIPGWRIRDQEGISQLVRELPRERAQRIVDDYVGPHVRRAFLGEGPLGFATPADYFAALDETSRTLRHDVDLVGRDEDVVALVAAIQSHRVVVVQGRGGIGKTRLLKAAAARLAAHGQRVLFALEGVQLDADLADSLPREPHVVVVDDAHRRLSDVATLLAAARVQRPGPKVVLAIRPGALSAIEREFAQAELELQDVAVLDPLVPLGADDVRALAAAVLGRDDDGTARLAEATSLLPLLTVLGGRLLRESELASDATALDAELRRRVMTRFAQEQLGVVTERVPPAQARELSTLVAALAPLNAESEAMIGSIAGHLGEPVSRVRSWLGDLQSAGVILARGRLRRVVPEVLGEQLLEAACFDAQGRPTGYAEELWDRFGELAAGTLLSNIGALDWRLSSGSGTLLDQVWGRINTAFRVGDAWSRDQLLETVKDAAIYQPGRALDLCRLAIRDPSRPADVGFGHRIDDSAVREKLPALLRAVAAHASLAAEAMELLWELGRDDPRPPHSHPDHAIRVFEELGGYRRGRAHQEQLLALVERRLADTDADDHHWSPLRLLDPMLERQGTTVRAVGHAFQWGSYNVVPEAARAVRDQVREVLLREALGPSARRRSIAATLLNEALRPSIAYFGRSVPPDVHAAWEDDEHATLDAIERVSVETHDAHVRKELATGLEWLAEDHGPWPRVSERAAAILETLRDDEADLVRAVSDPWHLRDLDGQSRWLNDVAQRVLAGEPDGGAVIARINQIYVRILMAGAETRAEPGLLVRALARLAPDLAREAWIWVLCHPEAPIAYVGEILLDEMRRAGATDLRALCQAALDTGELVMRRVVSGYLAGGSWFADPEGWEDEALAQRLADPDPIVQHAAAVAALRLGDERPELVLRLTLDSSSLHPEAADMLFGALVRVDLSQVSDEDLDRLAERLVEVPELDYMARQLLVRLGGRHPDRVIDVFIRRLHQQSSDETHRYDAVSYHEADGDLLGESHGDERQSLMTQLINEGTALDRSTYRNLGQLFWSLTVPGVHLQDIDAHALATHASRIEIGFEVLNTAVSSDEVPEQLVENVVMTMPWQLVLHGANRITDILGEVEAQSPRDAEELAAAFLAAGIGGLHGRTMGHESPRVRQTIDLASQARSAALPGSWAWKLYSDLVRWAEREAEDDRREDEETDWC